MTRPLISLERARLSVPAAAAGDERLLAVLLDAASDAVRAWCDRDFVLREYDELVDGCYGERLLLRHYPVQGVQSVRGDPLSVLEVSNTASSNQVATVTPTRVGLELFRAASATGALDLVSWASSATLTAVVSAVNALGNGWSARCSSAWAGHPSPDLFVPVADAERGAGLNAAGVWCGLRLHARPLSDYLWHPNGWLERDAASGWAAGPQAWRVRYTAGHATVPAAVQEACAVWVAELMYLTSRDPGLASLSTAGLSTQTWQRAEADPPPRARALLEPFRRRSV